MSGSLCLTVCDRQSVSGILRQAVCAAFWNGISLIVKYGFRFQVSVSVSGFGFGFGFRFWFQKRVSGWGFRVSGFGFRVSSFIFRGVLASGFCVRSFVFRVSCSVF